MYPVDADDSRGRPQTFRQGCKYAEATPCMDTLYTSNFNKVSFTCPLRCAVKGTHVNGSSEMHRLTGCRARQRSAVQPIGAFSVINRSAVG